MVQAHFVRGAAHSLRSLRPGRIRGPAPTGFPARFARFFGSLRSVFRRDNIISRAAVAPRLGQSGPASRGALGAPPPVPGRRARLPPRGRAPISLSPGRPIFSAPTALHGSA